MKKICFTFFLCINYILFSQISTVGVMQYNEGVYEGYSLFSSNRDTYLISNCGRIVNKWESMYRTGLSVYFLEDGTLLRTHKLNDSVLETLGVTDSPFQGAGGTGGGIERFDWDGNLIWSYTYATNNVRAHHDIEPLPNGNILILAWELKTSKEAINKGREASLLRDNSLWPEHIIEIEPVGDSGANIVWEWHLWDHLIQDRDSLLTNFGIISAHPELININYVGPDPNTEEGPADWIHANAIDYNEDLDQIIITSRIFSEFWIIDHSTTTEEAATDQGGNSGRGGRILYRWGNPEAYGRGDSDDRVLFGPHNAQWIDKNYPGANNILIFNNGNNRPDGDYSSVDELVPPLEYFNYNLDFDYQPYGPDNLEWTYVASNPTDFFADHISGCQRLPNGNTLICDGPQGRFFEVSNSGDIIWDYINPVYGNTILNQGNDPIFYGTISGANNSTFRFEKYSPEFLGFTDFILTEGLPIEGPPYIYPELCLSTNLSERDKENKIIQKIDILGRNNPSKGIYIEIYNDGSVRKKYPTTYY